MPPAPKKATTVKERVFVASGLGGQDDNIDTLGVFFEKMRATTVETVHIDDLLTFATCAPFFGVVMLETTTTVVKSCQRAVSGWDYEEEDAEDEWHRGAIASPIAGAEDDPARFSDAYLDVEALSPTEKIKLWRRALANDVESAVENFDPAGLIDVPTGDGSVVKVISPPVSPMFQQPSYPYSPVQGHHPQSFFSNNEGGVNVHLDVDSMLVDNPDADANASMGMGMGGVVMGRGAPDGSEFIDWSITSPTGEDQGDGRLSVGGSQDASTSSSSHEAELFPYDHHLTQFRAAQAFQEDTSFGREGFFEDNEPAPPEPKLDGEEDDEDEDGEDGDSEDDEEGSDEEEEGERGGGEQSSVDEEEAKREKEKDFMTKQFEDFQEQLRMKRIKEYQRNLRLEEKRLAKQKQEKQTQQYPQYQQQEPQWQPQEPEQDRDTKDVKPIGLVYLYSSQTPEDLLHVGEYSMGVYFHEDYRFQHLVCPAINQLVDLAFNNQDCHRLQSIIVDHPDKLYLLEALAKSGFKNEGVRRRGFYSNIRKEWTDVTYFAMLATEWVMDATNPTAPRKARLQSDSLWDEIFSRHQHECDELLRLEEKSSRLKRTTSLETIKEYNMTVDTGASNTASTSASASASTSGDTHESGTSAKRRRIESRRNSIRDSVMSARSSSARSSQVDPSETRWNFNMPAVETAPLNIPSRAGRPIAGPSRARRPSASGSSVSSISLQSFPSSSSSQWVDLNHEG